MDEISLEQIAREPGALLTLAKSDPRRAEALWHGLSRDERLRVVLAARGPERERLIVLAEDSGPLVRALAPDEFAASVLDLGAEDAGALIELCSDEQLTYLLDLTGWWKEVFAPQRYQVWLPLVMEAGVKRLQRWLANTDLEVLALLFGSWMRVHKWLPSQDEQEPPDDLPALTLDNTYFIELAESKTKGFVMQVLVLLKSELPELYGEVMEAMLWESPTELNEYANRWRRGRMGDHGFPDRMEALELWAPPAPGETDWQELEPKAQVGKQAPPRSDAQMDLLPPDEALPVAARSLGVEAMDSLKAEMAYIANCGVAALEADPAAPQEVAKAARESLGLVNLGLSILSGGNAGKAAQVASRLSLAALARQGAAAVRRLNHRAWYLMQEGWLKDIPTGFLVFDEPLDRWLAGLVFARPRCYDPSLAQDREYRSFTGAHDLERAEHGLALAEFWGELLFELLGIDKEQVKALFTEPIANADITEIKLSRIVGTWLARRAMGLSGLAPIPPERLVEAVNALQDALAGELNQEVASSLQAVADPRRARLAAEALGDVVARLKAEISGLKPEVEMDPRFVGCLLVGP